MRPRTILATLLATLVLTPGALAHDPRGLPEARAGNMLAAAFSEADADGPPLLDTAWAPLAVQVPRGRALAIHDGERLIVDVLIEDAGWTVVALDDEDARSTHILATPALVKMHEAAGASAADDTARAGTLGVFTTDASSSHAHAPGASSATSTWGAANAWVQWEAGDASERAFVLERTHAGTVLRFVFDADSIGAGLAPGRLVHLLVFRGDTGPVPQGPFLGRASAEVAELRLYPAAPGTSLGELHALTDALEADTTPARELLPLVGAAVFIGGATLAALHLRPPRVRAPAPVLAPAPRARHALRTVSLAALVVSSGAIALPAAGAPDALPPIAPPLFQAEDPCAPGSPVREYRVSAIDLDIIYNRWGDHDPQGMMYVLDEDISAVQAERRALAPVLQGDQRPFPDGTKPTLITPLVLRARLGECVVIQFTNRLDATPPPEPVDPLGEEAPHRPGAGLHGLPPVPASALPLPGPEPRRASLHVHGLPLDPRVSGADAAGWNPDTTVPLNRTAVYRVGAVREGVHFFHDHGDPTSAGRAAFPSLDEAFRGGTVHGLFGALVVEPADARWTDAYTGQPLRSGWRADVHTQGGSFREFVIFYHDPQLVARDGGEIREPMTDHGFNYRVETLSHRLFDDLDRCPPQAAVENRGISPCADISLVYSSAVHGDPGTPIPRAYVGDPVKMRLVHAGMEETHAHHLHGHRWQAVEGDPHSTRIDSQTITPSETFTETLEAGAGGQGIAHAPGDYIFHCHLFPHLYGGMWSFFRVHDRKENDLRPLPSHPPPPAPSESYRGYPHFIKDVTTPGYRPHRAPQTTGIDPTTKLDVKAVGSPYFDICPPTAPVRKYRLAALEVPIRYNGHGDHDPAARIFVLAEDADAILAGATVPDPPTLRVRQGECLTIELLNRLPPSGPGETIQGVGKVSIHTHLLEYDILGSDGTATGWIFDQTIWQNETITYRFYADRDLQTIVWHDHAAGLETAFRGIYGATLVEPPRSRFLDPETGREIYNFGRNASDRVYDSARDPATGRFFRLWRADIVGPGFKDFREFFASVQDFANLRNATGAPYRNQTSPVDFTDFGLMGLNLRSEPLWHRLGNGSAILNSSTDVFSSRLHGDPATNLWEAYPGDRTIVRVHQVAYEEIHAFQLQGHRWNFGYRDPNSPLVSTQTLGISEAFNAYLDCGAGGYTRAPGDYLYRTGGIDDVWAGGWGLFRVHGQRIPDLRPLPDADPNMLARADPEAKPCPPLARPRHFEVVALEQELLYNGYGDHDLRGRMLVLAHEAPLVRQGLLVPKPLTLRVQEGDCVHIHLRNELPDWSPSHAHADPQPTAGFLMTRGGPVPTTGSLLERATPPPSNHVALSPTHLGQNAPASSGNIGRNPETAVPPGGTRTYTYYADIPAPGAAFIEDLGDVLQNRHHGLFGAIVVLPKLGAALNPFDGLHAWNDVDADVHILGKASGGFLRGWRDFVVFNQNGVALTDQLGIPVALPGAHKTDVDAETAARIALAGLRDLVPGGAARARLTDVDPGPFGYVVRGTLEDRPFAAHVHRREGVLVRIDLSDDPVPRTNTVRITDPTGEGVPGVKVQLYWPGNTSHAETDDEGVASFREAGPRGTTVAVRSPDHFEGELPTWSDTERRSRLHLRIPEPSLLPEAHQAGTRALSILREHELPAGPVGLTAIDITGPTWRVSAGDALRTYSVDIDPSTQRLLSLTMKARALPFGNPSVLSEELAVRIARSYVQEHFGTDESVLQANVSRFGTWHVALGTTSVATDVAVDGVTGRILSLARGPASSAPAPLPDDGRGLLRFRDGGGGSLDGAPIEIRRGDTLLHSSTLLHGGRFILPESVRGIERGAGLTVTLPAHGFESRIALGPDGELFADLHGLSAATPTGASAAIEAARGGLAGLAASSGALVQSRFGLAGLAHEGYGWSVWLSNGQTAARFYVDDATGEVWRISVVPSSTPIDDCSGQVPERNGPHPTRTCAWSFSATDEEDQGLHAYNYRAEPLEHRLNRIPDPGLAFSSRAHGENGAPIWSANVGDKLTMHVLGANDKGRVTGFSISGHAWPREPRDPTSASTQGQGGLAPGSVFLVDPYGGAGGGSPLQGDYLVQGAVQRLTAETGEWGLLRLHDAREEMLMPLLSTLRLGPTQAAELWKGAPAPGASPCPGAVTTATATLEPSASGHRLSVSGWPSSLPRAASVPVAVRVVGAPELPLALLGLTASGPQVTSLTGPLMNTREGGTHCVLLDTRAAGSTTRVTLDAIADLDGDGRRSAHSSAQSARVAGIATMPTPPIGATPALPRATPTSAPPPGAPTPPPSPIPISGGVTPSAPGGMPTPATRVGPAPTPEGEKRGIPADGLALLLAAAAIAALLGPRLPPRYPPGRSLP